MKPSLKIPAAVDDRLRHVIALLPIGGVAPLCIRATHVAEDLLVEHFRIDVAGSPSCDDIIRSVGRGAHGTSWIRVANGDENSHPADR